MSRHWKRATAVFEKTYEKEREKYEDRRTLAYILNSVYALSFFTGQKAIHGTAGECRRKILSAGGRR